MKTSKKPRWKDRPAVVEAISGQLLTYTEVKKLFGWHENSIVRWHVARGHLKRIRVSLSSKGWRITAESAVAYRRSLEEQEQPKVDQAAARTQTMRAAKGFPAKDDDEVMLDQEAIVRSYNAGRRAQRVREQPEVKKLTLDDVIPAVPEPAARPDWRARNRWIETGMEGPDPWSSKR